MKFLVVLALVGVASCAPSSENRDKRSFGLPFAPAGELVQTGGEQTDVVQTTNVQTNTQKASTVKQSVFQPYETSALYPQPAVYAAPHFENLAYPVQSRSVYNYYSPQYAYKQPLETYPFRTYDASYPYNVNYHHPHYAYTSGTPYTAAFEPSVTYNHVVPTVY